MPGMTFKSVSLALLGMLLMAILSQFFGVFAAGGGAYFGTDAIPLNALLSFSILLAVGSVLFFATRRNLILPAEMLCILYVLLLAAPLMTTGFWRYMLASSGSIIKEADWEHYDILSPVLWPHGDDLLAHRLQNPGADGTTTSGHVHWETLTAGPGKTHPMPVLENTAEGEASSLDFKLPVIENGQVKLALDVPYLMTLHGRAQNLGAESRYYVRLIYDDHASFDQELFSSFDQKGVTYLEPQGFSRRGLYGFTLPGSIRDHVTVEVGLKGPGRLEVADLNFYNVSTLQGAYTGRRLVSQSVYDQLPPAQRTTLVVSAGSIFSWNGVLDMIRGYVPWSDWRGPIFFWGGYILLLTAATFALASLLRRQWVENERYPLPLTQVPIVLSGLDARFREGASYLARPYLWGGFGVMFLYSACNSLHFFFPFLPDFSINIALKSYLPDPSWGKTWETSLTFSGLFFALALFMDLNVLFSLVLGFFLFRFQYWLGESQGLTVDDAYPYPTEQSTGALLSYGLLILFVARRYLGQMVGEAWRGGGSDEVLSPRLALGLLASSFLGIGVLTTWAGIGVIGPLVLSGCVLLSLLVAMKLRAESGYPASSFLFNSGGGQTLLFAFSLFGSLSFFNPETAIFWGLFTSMFFNQSCFALVPGIQAELVALGHRLKVRQGDLVGAGVLGIVGGLVIGGWIYLSGAYSVGANNFPIVGQYNGLGGLAFLNNAVSSAGPAAAGTSHIGNEWFDAHHLAFLFGVGVTTALTFVRQLHAGFWFHPFGYILGSSQMMQDAWGSLLAAGVVRLAVLRLGGAASVREGLYPFAVGCVLAIIAVCGLTGVLHGYDYFFSPGGPKPSYQF